MFASFTSIATTRVSSILNEWHLAEDFACDHGDCDNQTHLVLDQERRDRLVPLAVRIYNGAVNQYEREGVQYMFEENNLDDMVNMIAAMGYPPALAIQALPTR